VQHFDPGKYPPESAVCVREFEKRGITYLAYATEDLIMQPFQLTKQELVVGDFDWTRRAMRALKRKMPAAPDYPKCL
jgi:hypothetical protein